MDSLDLGFVWVNNDSTNSFQHAVTWDSHYKGTAYLLNLDLVNGANCLRCSYVHRQLIPGLGLGSATANVQVPKCVTEEQTAVSPRVAPYMSADTTWTGRAVRWEASGGAHNTCLTMSCFLVATINRAAVFQHWLQPVEFIVWNSGQQTVTVVHSGDDETVDYCFPDVYRHV